MQNFMLHFFSLQSSTHLFKLVQIFLLCLFFFFSQRESTFSTNSSQLILAKNIVCLLLLGFFFPVTWTVLIPGIIKFAAFSCKCLPRHGEDEYLHYLHVIGNSQHFRIYFCYTMNLCFLPTISQQSIEVARFTLPLPSRLHKLDL